MNIDTGMAIVIVAVLVFYLRLIVIQRERAKRIARAPASSGGKKIKGKQTAAGPTPGYSVLSPYPRDRLIAGVGALAILAGILLNIQIIPLAAAQPYWWIPTALGVVAFSWAFKL